MPFSEDYESLFQQLNGKEAFILKSNPWIPRNKEQAILLKKETDIIQDNHKNIELIYLCNDENESEILKSVGLNSHFCNQNCFIDENIFSIKTNVEKKYDALYDAQIVAYKRHQLAIDVDNLALNGYISSITENQEYTSYVRENFQHFHWFQNPFKEKDHARFSETEVCDFINECRVGLCLSAEEGGMYASTQYLLCGLPVVNTNNRGGRNTFFHPDYVYHARDDSRDIAHGVEELKNRKLDPYYIRGEAIKIQKEHRKKFISIINEIFEKKKTNKKFTENNWNEVFLHKMGEMKKNKLIKKELQLMKSKY
jgi:glycosyltransferase involved in cell wall biosynthesis